MKIRYFGFFLLAIMSTKSFADMEFFLPNLVIPNGCVYQNLGAFTGTVIMEPIYEDDSTECNPGYYLPKNYTECLICTENFYCPGGVYVFSQTESQGIYDCPENQVSPSGTPVIGQCGKIMRVGNDKVYLTSEQQTTPALAVRLDNVIYYAKMTPVDENSNPMNENTDASLRSMLDGIEYSIHDNTIKKE